jgi:glycolate oxidase
VLIALTRMNRILAVDRVRRRAVVQPGVVNARLSEAVAPLGLYYVPDPSMAADVTLQMTADAINQQVVCYLKH